MGMYIDIVTMENSMEISLKKKLGIKLSYDPEITLLHIYSEKTITQKDTCTPVFIARLFTITRTWKLPRCSLTDDG